VTALTTVREHVEWFVDPSRYPVQWDLVLSWRTLLTVIASAVALGALYFAQRLLGDRHWPRLTFLPRMAIGAPTLLAVQAAIPLIYSGVQPVLLAPQLHLGRNPGGLFLGAVEVLIGFCFLTGIWDRIASALLVVLVLLGLFLFPPLDVVAQLHWVGIAVVIFAIGRQAPEAGRPRRNARWWQAQVSPERAVVWLRVLTGAAIMAPALSEKIWNPNIAEAFLRQHPGFNFPHAYLGMTWMSDERFILAAGIFEFAIKSCCGICRSSGSCTSCWSTAPTWPRKPIAPAGLHRGLRADPNQLEGVMPGSSRRQTAPRSRHWARL